MVKVNSFSTNRIAIDLGTSTLAARLVSLSGEILAEAQVANPQRETSVDILQRLQSANERGGSVLQSRLVAGLRDLVTELLKMAKSGADDIVAVAAAGNPGMSCLLRNLPVSSLLLPPHKPPYKDLTSLPADEIDLGLSSSLELFPLMSGFVGGDLVAVLIGLEALERGDSPRAGTAPGTLVVDIGTNAELALWDGSRWQVTSAAAGPAFEGGNIGAGMIMTDGAVTDVTLNADRLQLTVAGGGAPRGLCGSGLAALVAASLEGGLVDATGRIVSHGEVETNLGYYLVEKEDSWAIRFYHSASEELLLTQEDLRNFQLAKGAVLAGVQVLLGQGGFEAADIHKVIVTGALGTSLPTEVLKRVALLPEPMLDKTSFIANGVLAGLQAYLTAPDGQQLLADLVDTMRPFPLSGTPAFERHFLEALEL
jgi:uncharacterized 2Fe-2S/4Fe-4S cluster protein (DUF4445 family)